MQVGECMYNDDCCNGLCTCQQASYGLTGMRDVASMMCRHGCSMIVIRDGYIIVALHHVVRNM
jgi:hypothetical protein